MDAYIAECYSIEAYKKIYSHVLEPLEGQSNWAVADHVRPQAPGYIKMPGRPRKERKREEGEAPKGIKMSKVGGQITCSSCNRTGHNMKSCTNNAAATKHHGNAHIVRERSRKRKLQKEAYEAETSKKSKVEEVARQSKGKAVAQDLQVHECRRPIGIQIRETNSQPSSLPVSQPSSLKYDKHAPGSKARSAKVQKSAATPFVPPKQVTN